MTITAPRSEVAGKVNEAAARRLELRYGRALEAVVLTGSMSRDEGTVVQLEGTWRVLGDAEFLIIFRKGEPVPGTADLEADRAAIESALRAGGVECAIGLNRAYPSYLERMRPHIFAIELKAFGRVILGDPQVLNLIPELDVAEIPLEDAWQLLINRTIELLEPLTTITNKWAAPPDLVIYRAAKLYLDMATSLLIFEGCYCPGYSAREARLGELASTVRAIEWPFPALAFRRNVETATGLKLSRSRNLELDAWRFLTDCVRDAGSLCCWERERMTRPRPVRNRIRAWANLILRAGGSVTARNVPHWARLATTGSPRQLVYRAASELLFDLPKILGGTPSLDSGACELLRQRLPVVRAAEDGVVEPWRRLARDVVWNYQKFLIGTRI